MGLKGEAASDSQPPLEVSKGWGLLILHWLAPLVLLAACWDLRTWAGASRHGRLQTAVGQAAANGPVANVVPGPYPAASSPAARRAAQATRGTWR